MADVELVIKMPENTYKRIQALANSGYFEDDICGNSMRRIANGTPLPKGHGRLIDADKYLKSVCTYKETGCGSCKLQTTCPVDAPTIIEADKEKKNDR